MRITIFLQEKIRGPMLITSFHAPLLVDLFDKIIWKNVIVVGDLTIKINKKKEKIETSFEAK